MLLERELEREERKAYVRLSRLKQWIDRKMDEIVDLANSGDCTTAYIKYNALKTALKKSPKLKAMGLQSYALKLVEERKPELDSICMNKSIVESNETSVTSWNLGISTTTYTY